MPTNVYFTQGTHNEQYLVEDLIIESLKIYGQEMFYIPRSLVSKDNVLGEDRLSQFKTAFPIEMYFENVDSFGGQGAFIQKFGLMMEQSATLVVARRRWEQLVGRYGQTIIPTRPCEGDLIYFPLTKGLFEIKFVKHQDPFYQVGKLFVYKLQVELFQYASEKIDTGIKEIDVFETLKSFDTEIVPNGTVTGFKITNKGGGYATAPTVTLGEDWVAETAIAVGDQVCYDGRRYICTIAGTTSADGPVHVAGEVDNGTARLAFFGYRATGVAYLGNGLSANEVVKILVTEPGSGYTTAPIVYLSGGGGVRAAAKAIIGNLDVQDSYGDNNKFKEEAEGIVFNEDNPFGELSTYYVPPVNKVYADSSGVNTDSTTITTDLQ